MEINDRDFFRQPFTRAEIEELLQGRPPADMFSFRSPSFRALKTDQINLDDNDLIDLMLKEPRLIRRPIVKIGKNVYFGTDNKMLAELLQTGE